MTQGTTPPLPGAPNTLNSGSYAYFGPGSGAPGKGGGGPSGAPNAIDYQALFYAPASAMQPRDMSVPSDGSARLLSPASPLRKFVEITNTESAGGSYIFVGGTEDLHAGSTGTGSADDANAGTPIAPGQTWRKACNEYAGDVWVCQSGGPYDILVNVNDPQVDPTAVVL